MKKDYSLAELIELDPDMVSWTIDKITSNKLVYKKLTVEIDGEVSFYCTKDCVFEWMGTCSFSDDTDNRLLCAVMEATVRELVDSESYEVITVASNH